MSIQYAGGTNVNAVFTGNVKNDILTNVYTQLTTAGWSVVTGNRAHIVKESPNVRIQHPVHSLPMESDTERVQRPGLKPYE